MAGLPPPPAPHRRCVAFWAAVLAAAAGAAVWIDLSPLHRFHFADSIVPVLVSLQHWTPFYWEQDRLGMLIPWLAQPATHPLGNLMLQYGLTTFLALTSFVLAARYVLPRRQAVAAAALSIGLMLALDPPRCLFQTLMEQHQYATSLALGIAGLLAISEGWTRAPGARWAIGALLLALACWVNVSAPMALAPLVVVRGLWPRRRANAGPAPAGANPPPAPASVAASLGALAAALALGLWLSRRAPYHEYYGMLPPGLWAANGAGLVRNAAAAHLAAGWGWAWVLCAALSGLTCASPAGRRALPGSLRAAAVLLAGAAGHLLLMATVGSVWRGQSPDKYATIALILTQTALAVLLMGQWSAVLRAGAGGAWGRRLAWPAVAGGLALVLACTLGPPSPAAARRSLDQALGRHTPELLASGATHVVGSYWSVWPAVYHANLVLHERGQRRPVWGITHRSAPTRELWWPQPGGPCLLAAFAQEEAEVAKWLQRYGLPPLQEAAATPAFRLLRFDPAPSARTVRQ